MTTVRVLSPVGVTAVTGAALAPRPATLDGLRLGILDNGKPNSDAVLDRAAELLAERYGARVASRRRKRNTSLGAEFIDEFAGEVDVAIMGVGDCGGCATFSTQDSIDLERLGVPTVTVLTRPFEFLGRSVARNNQLPELPIVVIDHPIANQPTDTVAPRADLVLDAIVLALTGNHATGPQTVVTEPVLGGPEVLEAVEVEDSLRGYEQGNDLFDRREWTDTLPIVLPLESRVREFLDTWKRDPDEVVVHVPPRNGAATLEKIAVNMVMAGCRPEYLPVIEAALRAMSEERFTWINSITGTGMQTPLLIVSGSITDEIGLNGGLNALGPGPKANASIGRAIRFIQANIGGLRDQSTLGHPGKYSYVLVENRAANPWPALHTEYGVAEEESAVTVVTAQAPMLIKDMTSTTGLDLLHAMCAAMAIPDSINYNQAGDQVLMVCPQHAATLARDGFTRSDIQHYVQENALVPLEKFTTGFIEKQGRHRWRKRFNMDNPATKIPILEQPEDLIVVVAGGAGTTSAFIPTYCQSRRVTRGIPTVH